MQMIGRTGRSLIAFAAVWLFAAAAAAIETVTARATVHPGFARVVFDWPEPVTYTAGVDGRVLEVTFARPMRTSFDAVRRVLGDYVDSVRLADDGRTVEFGLSGDFRVRDFTWEQSAVFDILGDAAVAPEPEDDAAAPPGVPVRVGNHPGFSRVVFDWPGAVDYQVRQAGSQVIVRFDRAASINLTGVNHGALEHVVAGRSEIDGDATAVHLLFAPGARLRHFRAGTRVVIDALAGREPTPPETPRQPVTAVAAETGGTPPAATAEKAAPPDRSDTAAPPPPPPPRPVTLVPSAPAMSPTTPPGADNSIPEASSAGREPSGPVVAADAVTADDAAAVDDDAAVVTESDREEADEKAAPEPAPAFAPKTPGEPFTTAAFVVSAESIAPDKARLTLGPPSMTLAVENGPDHTLVTFNVGRRLPGAAFARGNHLWVVFPRPYTVDVAALESRRHTAFESVEQRAYDDATVLRFKLRPGYGVTMYRRGMQWAARFSETPYPPNGIDVEVEDDAMRGPRVRLAVASAGERVRLRDPSDGSVLIVVPVLASGMGVVPDRRFPEFDLLATAQGIVVRSTTGKVEVQSTSNGVEITAALLAETEDPMRVALRKGPKVTLFDLAAWRRGDDAAFEANRIALLHTAATAPDAMRSRARFALARFMFAHGYLAEALGVIEVMIADEPKLADNLPVRAMRGAISVMLGRVREVEADLGGSALDAYDDVALWRGMLAARRGDTRTAAANLLRAGDLWTQLAPPLRHRVALTVAEAALDVGDLAAANAHLDLVLDTEPERKIVERVNHLRGRVYVASGNPDDAVAVWRTVINGEDRLARVRALYDDTLLMLDNGEITPAEAIPALEALRYAWRGGAFEFALLRRLAELYIGVGRYANGLAAMKKAVTHFAGTRASAAVARRMNELFAEIFLGDGDLPTIEALTLFYDFQELTPVGADGDTVIQRLADRLVAVDLLGRAAALLEHQVAYRLKGVEKVRIGSRLAVIYLIDGKPKKALAVLAASGARTMPYQLRVQRRQLEARALADLGRDDEALARVAGDPSGDAESLRADIYWHAGDWPNAAAAIERALARTPTEAPMNPTASRNVLRLAVALVLADDRTGLRRVSARFAAAMRGDPNEQTFDLITAEVDYRAYSLRELPAVVAQVSGFEAFMSSYRERVRNRSLSAIN